MAVDDDEESQAVRLYFDAFAEKGVVAGPGQLSALLRGMGGEYTASEVASILKIAGDPLDSRQFLKWWRGELETSYALLEGSPTVLEKDEVSSRVFVYAKHRNRGQERNAWRFEAENLSGETIEIRLELNGKNVEVERTYDSIVPPFRRVVIADIGQTGMPWELRYDVEWRVPLEWRECLNFGEPRPRGIREGVLRDAWLVGAMAALAERPELFPRKEIFIAGVPSPLDDSTFPCLGDAVAFAACADPEESWVQVVERGVARGLGSYAAIENYGTVDDGFAVLGFPADATNVKNCDQLRLWLEETTTIVAAVLPEDDPRAPGRAYAVLDVVDSNVRLRDAWGPLGDDGDDAFWMPWAAFDSHFASLAVCRCGPWPAVLRRPVSLVEEDNRACRLRLTAGKPAEVCATLHHPSQPGDLAFILWDDDRVLAAVFPTRDRRVTTALKPLFLPPTGADLVIWSPSNSSSDVVVEIHSKDDCLEIRDAPDDDDAAAALNLADLKRRAMLAVADRVDYEAFSILAAAAGNGATLAVLAGDRPVRVTMDCSTSRNATSHRDTLVWSQRLSESELFIYHHLAPAAPGTWTWGFECDWEYSSSSS